MCFGFVGKTFNLPSTAPKWMKHKSNMNKIFRSKTMPRFRQKQAFLTQNGGGMLKNIEGIEVDTSKSSFSGGRAHNRASQQIGSNDHRNYSQNYLDDDGSQNNNRQLRGGSSRYGDANPQLSINRKDVRVALSQARRSNNGNLMLGKSVNKR